MSRPPIARITTLPCGMHAYTLLIAGPDAVVHELNRCECGKPVRFWSAVAGHVCDCGEARCNRLCCGGQ